LAPRPPPSPPLTRQNVVSLSQSSCLSPIKLTRLIFFNEFKVLSRLISKLVLSPNSWEDGLFENFSS
jgi:hypothetical protein